MVSLGNPVNGRIQANPEPWAGTPTFRVTSTFAQHAASGRALGIDIGNGRCGDQILAAADGAARTTRDPNGALIIRIKHPQFGTHFTGYAHMSAFLIPENVSVQVKRGQAIATLGKTGATACHLHFGLNIGGREVDPWPYLNEEDEDVPNLTTYAPAEITLGGAPLPVACRAAPSQSAKVVYTIPGGKLTTIGTVAADRTTWYPVWDTSSGKQGWYYVAAYNVPSLVYLTAANGDAAAAAKAVAAAAAKEAAKFV